MKYIISIIILFISMGSFANPESYYRDLDYTERGGKADQAWTRDNIQYFCFTEDSLKSKIQSIVKLAEEWSVDQENGMTPHQVCLADMKDIRRLIS